MTLSRYSDAGGTTLVAKTEYGYDGVGRITSVHSTDAGNSTINQFVYALDAADRVTQVIETQNSATTTATYGYDSASQLTADGTLNYTYDETGNRTGGSYGVTTGNRMTADANWSYSYNSNGNPRHGAVYQPAPDGLWDVILYRYVGNSPNNHVDVIRE